MTEIISTIDVCVTCMYAIEGFDEENAAEGAVEASIAAIRSFDAEPNFELLRDTGEETGFSMRPCDLCNSYLGGDRFVAYVVERVGA